VAKKRLHKIQGPKDSEKPKLGQKKNEKEHAAAGGGQKKGNSGWAIISTGGSGAGNAVQSGGKKAQSP